MLQDGADAHAAVGHRPRRSRCARRRAARRSRSPIIATRCWSAISTAATLTVIDRSDAGRTEDLAWSPDGAWLAYTFWTDARHCAIKLYDVAGKTRHAGHAAGVPRLRAGVRSRRASYLYFLSLRTFDPVYDSVQFELSFPRAARPYLIALQAGGRAAVRSRRPRA